MMSLDPEGDIVHEGWLTKSPPLPESKKESKKQLFNPLFSQTLIQPVSFVQYRVEFRISSSPLSSPPLTVLATKLSPVVGSLNQSLHSVIDCAGLLNMGGGDEGDYTP